MKPNNYILAYAIFAAAIFAAAPSAHAQKINGTPGSPESTITVDGNYLPAPPPAFGGVINMDVKNSKSCSGSCGREKNAKAKRRFPQSLTTIFING